MIPLCGSNNTNEEYERKEKYGQIGCTLTDYWQREVSSHESHLRKIQLFNLGIACLVTRNQ